MTDNVRIVTTGLDWMGSGVGSIESALREIIHEANSEIDLTVYSITSGAKLLIQWLEEALMRGVKVRIIINRKNSQFAATIKNLSNLSKNYPHLELYDFVNGLYDLHAKIVVSDRRVALVGSSNLSQNGLLNNYEIGVIVNDSSVQTIAKIIDRLIESEKTTRFV